MHDAVREACRVRGACRHGGRPGAVRSSAVSLEDIFETLVCMHAYGYLIYS